MPDFVNFWASMFGVFQDFLLSSPIVWFTGLFILFAILCLVHKALNIHR